MAEVAGSYKAFRLIARRLLAVIKIIFSCTSPSPTWIGSSENFGGNQSIYLLCWSFFRLVAWRALTAIKVLHSCDGPFFIGSLEGVDGAHSIAILCRSKLLFRLVARRIISSDQSLILFFFYSDFF